jgi:hypothetical protein
MPQIINNFIVKVLRLVREFFQAELYEYGFLNLNHNDSGKVIFVPTQNDVLRVWFSYQGHIVNPYMDEDVTAAHCFVSEAVPVPGGFQFQVIMHGEGECRISWFAIEHE